MFNVKTLNLSVTGGVEFLLEFLDSHGREFRSFSEKIRMRSEVLSRLT